MPLYRTTLRPAGGGGLPAGITWRYVEAPRDDGYRVASRHPDMPVSRHLYGVIETDRSLTRDELEHFDIAEVRE